MPNQVLCLTPISGLHVSLSLTEETLSVRTTELLRIQGREVGIRCLLRNAAMDRCVSV